MSIYISEHIFSAWSTFQNNQGCGVFELVTTGSVDNLEYVNASPQPPPPHIAFFFSTTNALDCICCKQRCICGAVGLSLLFM